MGFGKRTDQPEGASLPPSDAAARAVIGTQDAADPVARQKGFESPPIDPTAKAAAAAQSPNAVDQKNAAESPNDIPANDPRSDVRAPSNEGVMMMPSPEEKARDTERARLANEAAGVKPHDPDEKLSTEDRLTRIERALRAQGLIP